MRAFEMDVGARVLAGDPFRFARGQRDLAVDRQGQLERDARAAEREAGQIAGQRSARGVARRRPTSPRSRRLRSAAMPCPAVRGSGSSSRRRRAAMPAAAISVGAGRAALAGVGAGLERGVERRAARRSPASAARRPRHGGGRRARWRRGRRLRRPLTMTQPTLGLGAVRPRARFAERDRLGHPARVVTQCRAVSRAPGTGAAFSGAAPRARPDPSSARR